MQNYAEESLKRDIATIREHVLKMSRQAERALMDCITAFVGNDRKLAYAVILRDQRIDEKEKEIDRLCLEFLVRQQPVAGPLRFAYSTIRINLEIERIGDYAESIARHILRLPRGPVGQFRDGIVDLAHLSMSMFHDSIRAFVDQNADLAKENIEVSRTVDARRTQLNSDLVGRFKEQAITFEELDPLMAIVRRFERVSDQARNICMEVLYMCTGEYAKHPGAEAMRVLFVDDHNSCQSQMAEAIAQVRQQPKFVFSSAGVEPQSIDGRTIEFMKKKGFDLSRAAPKAVHQIPHLDYYQVVVALSESAHQAFPQRPRKMVLLDWSIGDPSKLQSSPETVEAAYQEVFSFLESQISDLIGAISAENETERINR